MKELLPKLGDTEAREAWDEVFSRDVLGSVILGGATGKFVENIISFVVLVAVGANASPWWATFGRLAAWSVAIPVGIGVFVWWHHVEEAAEEAAEAAAETVEEKTEE